MKSILTIVLSFLLVVSGVSQTRNVVVGTNDVIVSPTNFWNANASNGRTGLGLGSAATNPASAFQSSSSVLSNLASSNGVNLTNVQLTSIVGWSAITNTNSATSLLGFKTNGQVVANTGTNVLTFTNSIIVFQNPLIFQEDVSGVAFESSVGTNSTRLDESGISFGGSASSTTRANLGLGITDDVRFNSIKIFPEGEGESSIRGDVDGISFYWGEEKSFSLGAEFDILFFKPIRFVGATELNKATTRTNLGLGWSALTNSNTGTRLVSVDSNGSVVSPTNFWQVAPIQTLVQDFTGITVSQTNNATNARNVYVYSLATNVSGISNTIILPTNTSTFNGDEITVVHKGTTNTTTVVRQAGSTNNLITINRFDESIKFIRELGQWDFYHNISFVEPIQFSGTNAAVNVAASRTNFGLGATWLTNTNVTNFRTAIGLGTNASVVFEEITGRLFGFSDSSFGLNDTEATTNVLKYDNSNTNFWVIYDNTNFRSALGIPLAALTNTNNAKFQEAIFTTNAAPTNPTTPNFGDHAAWMGVSIVTNGVTNVFKIPLYK